MDKSPKTTADIDREMQEIKSSIEADKKSSSALLDMVAELDPSRKAEIDAMRKNINSEESFISEPSKLKIPEPTKENIPVGSFNTPPEVPSINSGIEDKRTLEEKRVDETRAEYVKEYLRSKAVAKARSSVFDVFKSKEKIEEKYHLSKEYKDRKREYDQARVDMGNALYNKKRLGLVESGIPDSEINQKLKEYKAGEILKRTILDEKQKLINAKAEGSPINPASWKKALNWYVKLSRPQRVLLSTSFFMGVGILTAGGANIAMLGVAGGRFARGMASGFISSNLTKFVDVWNRRKNNNFKATQDTTKELLKKQFGEGTLSQEEYEKKTSKLEAEDKKRQRNQTLAKLTVGIVAGAGFGIASSHIGSIGGHHPETPTDSHGGDNPGDGRPDATGGPDQPQTNTGHHVVEVEVAKGHGAIATIHELQEKLKSEYPDVTQAPSSVQHILNTSPDKLAMEYGMFKPGQDAESALIKMGSTFKADEQGNITFHQGGVGGADTLLEKGTDVNASNVYEGKMMDTDHSGIKINVGEHQNANISTVPEGTKLSNFDLNNTDHNVIPTVPEGGVNTLDGSGKIDLSGAKKLTENIRTTGAPYTGTIYPHQNVYNTGEEHGSVSYNQDTSSNTPIQGNGFTREVPMTNQEFLEHTQQNNIGQVGSGRIMENNMGGGSPDLGNLQNNPHHLETAADVRHLYGADNVRIDKPDTDTINGMKWEEWNREVDHKFQELHNDKNIKLGFNSYDQYEKEKELQTLLGTGEKRIDYIGGKNVEHVEMNYFRTTPEWVPIESKIPAKYFFDFKDVKLIDGKPLPQADIDQLLKVGMIKDTITTNADGVAVHEYVFKNHDQLERLQKMYERLTPKADQVLGNDKPIGNETLDKYIERITHKVYETDNGTLWGTRENWDGRIVRNLNNPGMQTSGGNVYQPNSNSTYVDPRYGLYQSSSEYNRRLTNQALDIIGGYSRWTH